MRNQHRYIRRVPVIARCRWGLATALHLRCAASVAGECTLATAVTETGHVREQQVPNAVADPPGASLLLQGERVPVQGISRLAGLARGAFAVWT